MMEKGDSAQKKRNSNSSVFKTGAISLAFMVIGYQAALFINRAALLGIEAARDHPDTVYVVRHVYPQHEELQEYAEIPSEREPFDTIRVSSAHSARVLAGRERMRRVESFPFDPNTVSQEDLVRLGFSVKQAAAIANYRVKGGRFRRKEDFAKSFVVADSVYRRLEPFINIPKVDINTADSAAFDALPGIGPYFAARMVRYREELGGYSFPEQLLDIYNFGAERYEGLIDLICCSEPEAYRLWTLPADELRKHPYIRTWQAADAIVLYRENNPPDSLSVEGIAAAGILPEEDASRLARCRIAEPNVSGGD